MLRLSGADKATRLATRNAFIPKGSRLVPGPAGGAVYVYETAGRPYAIAFRGTAARSEWHHSFRTIEQRDATIAEFHTSLTHSAEFKAKRKAEKSAWVNPLKVGDILHSSWGYDQTNVEFYAVTKVSGRRVWIREIAQDFEATGFMSGKCWPAMPIRFCGEETMHVAQPSGTSASVKIDHHYAWPENGREHYTSSYA